MKFAIENRTRFAVAAGFLLLAVLFAGWTFSSGRSVSASSNTPAPNVDQPKPPPGKPASARRGNRDHKVLTTVVTASLDPRLELDRLRASESIEYGGNGRNIFRAEADPVIPKPLDNGLKNATNTPPPQVVPQGPPPPPPIPLKFFGYASDPSEPKRVFLAQGEDVFVAKEGDIVNRRYKIVKINPNSVEIEDVLSNNRQTVPMTQG